MKKVFLALAVLCGIGLMAGCKSGTTNEETNDTMQTTDSTTATVAMSSSNYEFMQDCMDGFVRVKSNGKWGFVNYNDEVVVNPIYDSVDKFFTEGMCAVMLDGKWGYVDENGKIVVKPQYDDAGPMYCGRAYVSKNGLFGYIDKKGNIVIPLRYDGARVFQDGVGEVLLGDEWILIDTTGFRIVYDDYFGKE